MASWCALLRDGSLGMADQLPSGPVTSCQRTWAESGPAAGWELALMGASLARGEGLGTGPAANNDPACCRCHAVVWRAGAGLPAAALRSGADIVLESDLTRAGESLAELQCFQLADEQGEAFWAPLAAPAELKPRLVRGLQEPSLREQRVEEQPPDGGGEADGFFNGGFGLVHGLSLSLPQDRSRAERTA